MGVGGQTFQSSMWWEKINLKPICFPKGNTTATHFVKTHWSVHSYLDLLHGFVLLLQDCIWLYKEELDPRFSPYFQQKIVYSLEETEPESLWLKDLRPSRKHCYENRNQLKIHTLKPVIPALFPILLRASWHSLPTEKTKGFLSTKADVPSGKEPQMLSLEVPQSNYRLTPESHGWEAVWQWNPAHMSWYPIHVSVTHHQIGTESKGSPCSYISNTEVRHLRKQEKNTSRQRKKEINT